MPDVVVFLQCCVSSCSCRHLPIRLGLGLGSCSCRHLPILATVAELAMTLVPQVAVKEKEVAQRQMGAVPFTLMLWGHILHG